MLTNAVDNCFNSYDIQVCKTTDKYQRVKHIYNFRLLWASHAIYDGVIRTQTQVETEVQMSLGRTMCPFSCQPYEALIQRDRNPTIHDNIAGTQEKDRGRTHMGDVAASESLKGICESDPSRDSTVMSQPLVGLIVGINEDVYRAFLNFWHFEELLKSPRN